MIVVGVGAFVRFEVSGDVMVVFRNFGGQLGFFECIIDDFMGVANPAALRLVGLIWI